MTLFALLAAGVDTRDEYHDLWWYVYVPVLGGTVVVVYTLVFVAIVRGRRRKAEPEKEFPKRSHPLAETLYVVGLIGIAATLFLFTFKTEQRVDAVADDPDLRVTIEGFQWQWRFTYPDHGIVVVGEPQPDEEEPETRPATIPELVVPVGQTVQFSITARDVIHSWFVPFMRFKRDANPNLVNVFDLRFPEPGVYPCRCTEYCGLAHTTMRCRVRVVPEAQFERWVAEQGEGS